MSLRLGKELKRERKLKQDHLKEVKEKNNFVEFILFWNKTKFTSILFDLMFFLFNTISILAN